MKVVHGPSSAPFNPYLFSLTGALEELGVSTRLWCIDNGTPTVPSPEQFGNPDILHLHWLHRLQASIPAPRLAEQLLKWKRRDVRIVWTVHNLIGHESPDPEAEFEFNKWFAQDVSDEIIVHSESARRRMMSEYQLTTSAAGRITIVPHPGYVEDYPADIRWEVARERLSLGPDDRVLLFLGSLRPYKGVERALRAFRQIADERLRFLVAGQPFVPQVADRVAKIARSDDRVTLALELIPREVIQTYMAAADVVVLPFVELLTSGSMMLAMSFGKPLLVPEMDVIRETVDERGVVFFDADSEASLVRALQTAGQLDRESLDGMGRHNFQIASRRTWDCAARQTHAVYQRVMACQPEPGALAGLGFRS